MRASLPRVEERRDAAADGRGEKQLGNVRQARLPALAAAVRKITKAPDRGCRPPEQGSHADKQLQRDECRHRYWMELINAAAEPAKAAAPNTHGA